MGSELTPFFAFSYSCKRCVARGEIRLVCVNDEDVPLPDPDICPVCGGPARSRFLGSGETVRVIPFAQIIPVSAGDFAGRTTPDRRCPIVRGPALRNGAITAF